MNKHRLILKNINLLKKYDVHAFDYIEYPHKSFWNNSIDESEIRSRLKNIVELQTSTMLYIHIPFCEQLCTFCLCHRQITSDKKIAMNYLKNSLFLEIDLMKSIAEETGKKFNIKEVYFGGGSPTYLNEEEFLLLKNKISEIVDYKNIFQFSVEIDPRRVKEERLIFYAENGVNKISFGVQDFDIEVQKNINRIQPSQLMHNLLTTKVRNSFKSINFDLLVGLPGQTIKSINATINEVIKLKPDRIALAYLAYNPDFHPHQRHMMLKQLLPDFYERKALFVEALDVLSSSQYIRTGFEHFALPEDDVSKALKSKKTYYNSFGATTGNCTTVLALGRSSYSTIGDDLYYQNFYNQNNYEKTLQSGKIPFERGWVLNRNDILRREIIKDIRTFFELDIEKISNRHNINFDEYFKEENSRLKEFFNDNLIYKEKNKLILTEDGKHFANLIGSNFDTFLKTNIRFNQAVV